MIVYQENGLTIRAYWCRDRGRYVVEGPDTTETFDRSEAALAHAARVAGVSRLSSAWQWRLVGQRERPHTLDPQPNLVDVTGKPWLHTTT